MFESGIGAGAGDERTKDAEIKRNVMVWKTRGNMFRDIVGLFERVVEQ